jgi:hypothetical protein
VAERVRHWKESGKTAEAFAIGQPFKASALKWRAAELRRAGEGGERSGKGQTIKSAIRLARVVSRARAGAPTPGGGLVIHVSGARITVSRGFDAELLIDVVRAPGAVR